MGNSYSPEPEGYDSEDLTYEQIVFPLRIKLNSNPPAGALSRRRGIVKGVELNIHFMKTTAAIMIESTTTGQQYILPLVSTTPFSPLYVPDKHNMEAALNGYTFDSVSDIIHAAPVPSAVCASEGYVLLADDQSRSSTLECIEKDDILTIDTTRLLHANSSSSDDALCDVLSCYNVSQSQHVELMSDCVFKFTTQPDKVSLLPKELFRHCHTPLPMSIVHNTSHNTSPMQSPMVFNAIKWFSLNTFIISQHNPLPSVNQTTDLLEVHIDHPVQYETLYLSPLDDKNLRDEACEHFSVFLTNTQTVSITLLKNDEDSFQNSLLTYTPSAQQDTLFHMIPPMKLPLSTTTAGVQCTVDVLAPLPPPPMLDLPQLSCDLAASSDYNDDNYCHLYESLDSITANAYLQTKTSEETSNKEFLKNCTCQDVCKILEGISLGQYKELFLNEKIDGLLLLELDDEILSTDLGMTKRLHRLKLQRVIEGRESIITHTHNYN